jgi:hypothetical protein
MPSGWFPDPHGRHEFRFFNGTAWTADVSDEGRRYVDPYGAAPLGPVATRPGVASGPGNGPATAAITCGLIAMFFAWMPVFVVIGIVLGALGLVFGMRGLRRARLNGSGRGRAITGIVTGGASLALSVVGIVLTVSLVSQFRDFLRPGLVDPEIVSCTVTSTGIVIDATVQNLEADERSYTVYAVMQWPRVSDLVVTVDTVAPGEVRRFTLERAVSVADDTCSARLVVHGPTPYGIEMDRVND